MPPGSANCRIAVPLAMLITVLVACDRGPALAHDDGQWTMPGKDYAATRFSGLTEITAANAKDLHATWSFSTGVLGGHEGQPLVVLEAMAAGLPVLASDHGVIGATVVDGVTGRLVPKEAPPEKLAEELWRMLADKATLARYGARGRERYLERYTLKACHARLFEVFEKALGA